MLELHAAPRHDERFGFVDGRVAHAARAAWQRLPTVRATCWVTSTSATARSRVALSTDNANVQASTTSPVVAAPLLPQRNAQASRPSVRRMVRGHEDAELFQIKQAPAPRLHLAIDRGIEAAMSRQEAAKRRTSGMLLMTSTISPSTVAALSAKS